MTGRRAIRRRYAILGALAHLGPSTAQEIGAALRRSSPSLGPDLAYLERDKGLISSGPGSRISDLFFDAALSPARDRLRLTQPPRRVYHLAATRPETSQT